MVESAETALHSQAHAPWENKAPKSFARQHKPLDLRDRAWSLLAPP
jgi:hypothetical protein